MGAVLSSVQCAASTVYNWGLECFKAAASWAKAIWQSFTDCLSKIIHVIKSMTCCFRYSDHTTSATTTTNVTQGQRTRQVQVRETKVQVKLGYNCDDEENDPIKEEKKKIGKWLKGVQTLVNEAVEIFDSDEESDKTTARVKDLMDGQNTQTILDYAERRLVPQVL